jgi:hypothetical protein
MTLLAVFTCSDWLMDIRKRRKTKARQVAQQQAREHISSLERWKQAKETAKRGATHLTRKLSRSLSSRMRRPSYSMDISQVCHAKTAKLFYNPESTQYTMGTELELISMNFQTQLAEWVCCWLL